MHFSLVRDLDGIAVFLTSITIIAVINCFAIRRLRRCKIAKPLPLVSVLVPAKDEALNIESCLKGLMAQDYLNYELLVLIDGSTDGTREIAEGLAAENRRLSVIEGQPRPEGWLGKHWACHQLAERASGEILLFTDADTTHKPASIGHAASMLVAEKMDFLTAIVAQDVRTFGERLIVPPMTWAIVSFSPLPLAYALKIPAFATANGQFMMFTRRAYDMIGGHESVKGNVVDDIALAKRIVAAKLKWRLLDAHQQVSCRMYRSFREAWAGLTKNLFGAFDYNIPFTVFVWIWLPIVFIEPIIVLCLWASGVSVSVTGRNMAALLATEALALWVIIYLRFGTPVYLAALYPLKIVIYAILAMNSMYANLTGKAVWKGQRFSGHRSPLK